jgi:hypothetical protein
MGMTDTSLPVASRVPNTVSGWPSAPRRLTKSRLCAGPVLGLSFSGLVKDRG